MHSGCEEIALPVRLVNNNFVLLIGVKMAVAAPAGFNKNGYEAHNMYDCFSVVVFCRYESTVRLAIIS